MRSPRRSAAAAVLVASLTACSTSADGGAWSADDVPDETAETSEPSGPGAPQPSEAPPPADDSLLAFSGRQLDGGTFDGAAVTGDVVVWFWTPW